MSLSDLSPVSEMNGKDWAKGMQVFGPLRGFWGRLMAMLAASAAAVWISVFVGVAFIFGGQDEISSFDLVTMVLGFSVVFGVPAFVISFVVVRSLARRRCILTPDSLEVRERDGEAWAIRWGEIIAVRFTVGQVAARPAVTVAEFAQEPDDLLECECVLGIRAFPRRQRAPLVEALRQRLEPQFDLDEALEIGERPAVKGEEEDKERKPPAHLARALRTARIFLIAGAVFTFGYGAYRLKYGNVGVALALLCAVLPLLPYWYRGGVDSHLRFWRWGEQQRLLGRVGAEGLGWMIREDLAAEVREELDAMREIE